MVTIKKKGVLVDSKSNVGLEKVLKEGIITTMVLVRDLAEGTSLIRTISVLITVSLIEVQDDHGRPGPCGRPFRCNECEDYRNEPCCSRNKDTQTFDKAGTMRKEN